MTIKKKLGHIALRTNCFEKTIAFYEQFGGAVTDTDLLNKEGKLMRLAMVAIADFVIEVIETPGLAAPTADERFTHLCIEVDKLDEYVQYLKEIGVNTFVTENILARDLFGGIRQINLMGPNQEVIELLEGKF